MVRGTDFDLKPKGHFIQPPIETVIEEVKGLIGSGRYRYIYLATEDERLAEIIKAKFKGIVIENEREYYGELFRDIQETSIGYVRNNMTDEGSRKKDLSYASSINLLAHCAGLVAGNCGGSQAAVCINGLKYEYRHVYDIGLYT